MRSQFLAMHVKYKQALLAHAFLSLFRSFQRVSEAPMFGLRWQCLYVSDDVRGRIYWARKRRANGPIATVSDVEGRDPQLRPEHELPRHESASAAVPRSK
jgi:hypothetical protein